MATQTVTQQIAAGTYDVDPIHSSVTFAVTHNGVSTFRSGFAGYEARLAGGEGPRLEGTVDVASIEVPRSSSRAISSLPSSSTRSAIRKLRFSSSELSVDEDGSVTLRGELEIKGRKHEVETGGRFAQLGADLGGKARVGLSLEATVDRRDFGLDWSAELPSGGQVLEYEVSIAVELELVGEAE